MNELSNYKVNAQGELIFVSKDHRMYTVDGFRGSNDNIFGTIKKKRDK